MTLHTILSVSKALFDVLNEKPDVSASELRTLGARLSLPGSIVFELEAWRREPVNFDETALRELTDRVDAIFKESIEHREVLQVACDAAATLVRVAAAAGFDAEPIAKYFEDSMDRVAVISDAHAAAANASRFPLLEGLYDARILKHDHAVLIDADDRRRCAEEMLLFISNRLDPAAHHRTNALEQRVDAPARAEVARVSIAQEHRRLSWEASLAAERYGEERSSHSMVRSIAQI